MKKKLIPKAQLGTILNTGKILTPIIKNPVKNIIRKQLYNNIDPFGYSGQDASFTERVVKSLFTPEEYYESPNKYKKYDRLLRKNIFARYLQIPVKEGFDQTEESPYKPSKAKDKNTKYYRFKHIYDYPIKGPYDNPYKFGRIENKIFEDAQFEYGGLPKENEVKPSYVLSDYLGVHNLSRGRDENGDYISYYDKWDINPLEGESKEIYPSTLSKLLYGNKQGDVSMGIGKPVEFYDRLYFDDYYGVTGKDRGSHWLPEVNVFPENK